MINKEINADIILSIISSMRDFPGDGDALDVTVQSIAQEELSVDELEYVAAAYKNAEGKSRHED